MTGHMQCSKMYHYSIISSARPVSAWPARHGPGPRRQARDHGVADPLNWRRWARPNPIAAHAIRRARSAA